MFHFTVSLCSFLRFCVSVSFHFTHRIPGVNQTWNEALGLTLNRSRYLEETHKDSGRICKTLHTVTWAEDRTPELWDDNATRCTTVIQTSYLELQQNVSKCLNLLRFATVYRWICTKYSLYPTFFPPFPSPSFCHSPLVTPVSSLRSEPHLLSLRNFCED